MISSYITTGMPYAARGQTLSCGIDMDLKTSIEDNIFKAHEFEAQLDKHVVSGFEMVRVLAVKS